jgi:hypothetical protein
LREKALRNKNRLTRFLKFILFALFFIRKKRAVKEAEKRAVLSPCHFFAVSQNFLRLPEFDFCSYLAKITRNHGALKRYTDFLYSAKRCVPRIKAIRAYSAFADHRKAVKHYFASRFRGILRGTSKNHRGGEAHAFRLFYELTKR